MSVMVTDNDNYTLRLFGDNILYTEYIDSADIDLIKIKEIESKRVELTKSSPFYSVVNMRNVFGAMIHKAKDYIAKSLDLNSLKKKEFLCFNSFPLKLLVSGYLKLNKPMTETIVVKSNEDLLDHFEREGTCQNGIKDLREYLQGI